MNFIVDVMNVVRRELVRKLMLEGKLQEIAELDVALEKLKSIICAKHGGRCISIPGRSKELAEARNQKIARDYKSGLPVTAIMARHGLSRAAVYKILKKQNEILHLKK